MTPLFPLPANVIPRAAIFLSGSGSNAERILEAIAASGAGAPLQVACLVTDAPATSRAGDIGRRYGIPVVEHDIREFYRRHGLATTSLATPEGRSLRDLWTAGLREALRPHAVHFGIFAGFVPLTNITGDFPCLNVHPGDLTYLKDGRRWLVGLHSLPVERAILDGLDHLRSSVIVADPYTDKGDDMDSGIILGISGKVPVDLQGQALESLREQFRQRPPQRPKGGYGDALEALGQHNLTRLKEQGDWIVFPQVVFDFAAGKFLAEGRELLYLDGTQAIPVKTVAYEADGRHLLPR